MTRERLSLFDTTLRDGQQTQGVDFSATDKARIARALDDLGLDYVEGGWPGSNPTDTEVFRAPPSPKPPPSPPSAMTKPPGRPPAAPDSPASIRGRTVENRTTEPGSALTPQQERPVRSLERTGRSVSAIGTAPASYR